MARDYSGLKHHAKVHSFRIATAIVAWILIVGIFYYRPDWLKWGLRGATHGIEAIGDSLPYPWGDRIEIVLRELGGIIWLQIRRYFAAAVCFIEHRIGMAVSARPLRQLLG